MYIPKATKLPSGNWRVRLTVDGKTKSITRPTRKEAEKEAAALKSGAVKLSESDISLTDAIDRYIETKQGILSPTTIRGYHTIQRNMLGTLKYQSVTEITDIQWQKEISTLRKTCSSKTIENWWRLMSSIRGECGLPKFKPLLPQVISQKKEWLHPDQIEKFMEALKGEAHEVPILLALHSLRVSEVLAVRWSDIDLDKEEIAVEGAIVMKEGGEYVEKEENKNITSRRVIPFMLPQLVEAVKAAEKPGDRVTYVRPSTLSRAVQKVCRKAGLPQMTMQGLRKSFASLCAHAGIPKDHVRECGGWANTAVLDAIYTEILRDDVKESMEKYKDAFK